MSKQQKIAFWVCLSLAIFALFRWLFGMAIPEASLEFSIGAAATIMSGLLAGRGVMLVALQNNAIKHPARINGFLVLVILTGFLAIAYLLNAMIEETTLFPFALTVLLLFLINMATASLFTLIRSQYKAKVISAQAAMAQSKSELELLQSRLSPHFLFNTLNNLYGLSLNEPQRVPPLLLKLSGLLRYSVYDAKELFVPVREEIEYLRNYVDFERLRLGDRLKLQMDLHDEFHDICRIPPLLLIVFVENAFKHSRNTKDQYISIDITLGRKSGYLIFSVRNSCAVDKNVGTAEKNSGFGLQSVKKRLDLLYRGKHRLVTHQSDSEYAVELTLECQ